MLRRFPWFILALGVLPLIAEIISLLRPKSHGGRDVGHGRSLFAVIAVLYILMANLFYNISDNGGVFGFDTDGEGINDSIKTRLKVTLSGFAIAAAFALLAMLLAPLTGAKHERQHSFTTTQSENRGAVIYPPTATTGAVVTGQETHTTVRHHGTTAPQVVVA